MCVSLIEFVKAELYPKLNVYESGFLSPLLLNARSAGGCFDLICPRCWSHSAHHYLGSSLVSCGNCNAQTSILDSMVLTGEYTLESAAEAICEYVGVYPSGKKTLKLSEASSSSSIKLEKKNRPKKISCEKPEIKVPPAKLLSHLRVWLKKDPLAKADLIKAGWSEALMLKAPIGKINSVQALRSIYCGMLPLDLYRSASKIKSGIVVPWFISDSEVSLWGYSGSILNSAPSNISFATYDIPPCHAYHPVNKRHNWLVVVRDPLLASLLIARGIPCCAVGDSATLKSCVAWFAKAKSQLYILSSRDDDLFSDISKQNSKAINLDSNELISFGPYSGQYYKRFVDWPELRFKEVNKNTGSELEVIELLLKLLKSGLTLEQANKVLKYEKNCLITINALARSLK